jgi:hypothetical protein
MNFPAFVMLNLFQQNKPQSRVILKQVQDDERERSIFRRDGDDQAVKRIGHRNLTRQA